MLDAIAGSWHAQSVNAQGRGLARTAGLRLLTQALSKQHWDGVSVVLVTNSSILTAIVDELKICFGSSAQTGQVEPPRKRSGMQPLHLACRLQGGMAIASILYILRLVARSRTLESPGRCS
jgi:hypothetical protein